MAATFDAVADGLGTLGDYRLIRRIASGGMADIYLASVRALAGFEKFVALKRLHSELSQDERFSALLIEEAKITVELQHACIVQVFDLGRVGDVYYIAMEYVEGADLFQILRRLAGAERRIPIDAAAYIAREVCAALDYAHTREGANGRPLGIVHRDISPQNVLCGIAGEVKVADFGIAKATSLRAERTAAGVIKGKYQYMSPEQSLGEPIDARADVFSAGVVLWEMLAGEMLHGEDDMQVVLAKVRRAEVPPLRSKRADVPAALEEIVSRAVARDPAGRWQRASEMLDALQRFLVSYAPEFGQARMSKLVRDLLPPPSRSSRRPTDVTQTGTPQHTPGADSASFRGRASQGRESATLDEEGAATEVSFPPPPDVPVETDAAGFLPPERLMTRNEFAVDEHSVLGLAPAPPRRRDAATIEETGAGPTTPGHLSMTRSEERTESGAPVWARETTVQPIEETARAGLHQEPTRLLNLPDATPPPGSPDPRHVRSTAARPAPTGPRRRDRGSAPRRTEPTWAQRRAKSTGARKRRSLVIATGILGGLVAALLIIVLANRDATDPASKAVLSPASGAPAFGRVTVRSEPRGANVWIDGRFAGRTPITVDHVSTATAVDVVVSRQGYVTARRIVAWQGQATLTADFLLERAPRGR